MRDQDLYNSNLFIYEFTGLVTSLMVKHGWCRDLAIFGPKKALVDISHSLTESLRHNKSKTKDRDKSKAWLVIFCGFQTFENLNS